MTDDRAPLRALVEALNGMRWQATGGLTHARSWKCRDCGRLQEVPYDTLTQGPLSIEAHNDGCATFTALSAALSAAPAATDFEAKTDQESLQKMATLENIIAYLTRRCQEAEARPHSLTALMRDISTVRQVAQRRSDPDHEHQQMVARLKQWEDTLYGALSAAPAAGWQDIKCIDACQRNRERQGYTRGLRFSLALLGERREEPTQ